TQAGQNLYIGNSQYNTGGQYVAPPWVRPTPDFEQSDFAEYARKVENRRLSHGQVSRFYVRAALDWAKTHPRDFTRLLWRKATLYFSNFEVPDNQDIYFFARYSWVLRLPLFSFGVVFALGLAAMVLLGRELARLSLVVFFFVYAASVVVFFVFSRYRIPALSALLPFAGAMVLWLADAVRGPRSSRARRPISPARVAGALVLVLATFAATLVPSRPGQVQADAAISLVNLAGDYCLEGDTAQAIRTYEQALATDPGLALASRELGRIMIARNDLDRALRLLSDAARANPSDPYAHVFLGEVRQRLRQFDAAVDEFSRAVALAPGRVEFRLELAAALQQLDRCGQALAQYDTLVLLAPDNPAVRHNYAVCLYSIGRLDEARLQLEAAHRLGGPANTRFDSLLNPVRRPAD
ncbi:tetratricopeptide repeat protein, partial [candidate division WOR-3 bacterium]|nr:tetratricopeptide repeat protein [candidate division WOR-3 bacterium]